MKKRSMLAIASLATGCVVAAVTPSHASGSLASVVPPAGGQTKLAGLNVDDALETVGRTINRETDRAVNDAPHGKSVKKG